MNAREARVQISNNPARCDYGDDMSRLTAILILAVALPLAATADELRVRVVDSQNEPLQHAVVTLAVGNRVAAPSTSLSNH